MDVNPLRLWKLCFPTAKLLVLIEPDKCAAFCLLHGKAAEAAPHCKTQAKIQGEITATFWSAAVSCRFPMRVHCNRGDVLLTRSLPLAGLTVYVAASRLAPLTQSLPLLRPLPSRA